MLKHIPNILTVIRFFIIPLIISALANNNYILAFVFLTLSGLTDVLDGAIARKFNFITNFGKLIDPLADKMTQLSVLCTLCLKGIIPFWILTIVVLKEACMVSGASFLYGKELVVSSKWYGKASTVLFYLAITVSLVSKQFNFALHFDMPLYYLALIITIFSLIMYFREFYMEGYFKKENLKLNEEVNTDTKKI